MTRRKRSDAWIVTLAAVTIGVVLLIGRSGLAKDTGRVVTPGRGVDTADEPRGLSSIETSWTSRRSRGSVALATG